MSADHPALNSKEVRWMYALEGRQKYKVCEEKSQLTVEILNGMDLTKYSTKELEQMQEGIDREAWKNIHNLCPCLQNKYELANNLVQSQIDSQKKDESVLLK